MATPRPGAGQVVCLATTLHLVHVVFRNLVGMHAHMHVHARVHINPPPNIIPPNTLLPEYNPPLTTPKEGILRLLATFMEKGFDFAEIGIENKYTENTQAS